MQPDQSPAKKMPMFAMPREALGDVDRAGFSGS